MHHHIGLVQERRNSIANVLELRLLAPTHRYAGCSFGLLYILTHYGDVTCYPCCLNTQATRLLIQQTTKNINAPRSKSTNHRWIPVKFPWRAGNAKAIQCHAVIMFNRTNCQFLHHDDVIKWKLFRATDPLWGASTGHRWIPFTKASDAEFWCFLCLNIRLSKQSRHRWFETPSGSLWRHCNVHGTGS